MINRSRRYDFPRSLEPALLQCESERSAGTTLAAEGYHEPQERARQEVEGPRNRKKNSSRAMRASGCEILARESSKDLVYMFIHVAFNSDYYMVGLVIRPSVKGGILLWHSSYFLPSMESFSWVSSTSLVPS